MADNDPRAASATTGTLLPVASDDIGGVHYQRVKIHLGADGVAGGDATPTNPLPTRESAAATAAVTVVAASQAAAGVTVLAANTNRKKMLIFNDSALVLYLKFGTAPSATSYSVRLATMSMYESALPVYTGIVTGVWAAGTLVTTVGAKVTEMT